MEMPTQYNVTFNDYDDERGSFGFQVVNLTAANYDAQATLQNAFNTAMLDLSTGVVRKQGVNQFGAISRALPSNQAAQREIKYLVTMLDGTADKLFQFEIPCADMTLLPAASSYLVLRGTIQGADAGGEIAAFIAATEAYYLSPYGNAATVWEIELVGRNN